MPDIDPSIVSHQLNVDANARYVSHHKRRQSLKKVEGTYSKVKGLLDTHFISKDVYT